MTLVTDLEELKQLADARHDTFDVMRYQLQDDDDLDDATIDAVVDSLARPIIEAIDCKTCANCCRQLDVQVGEDDIERLAAGIDVPIADIRTEVIRQDHEDPDIVGVFKHKPCTYLQGTMCSVYPQRPTSCRDYPQFTPDFRWTLNWMIEGAHLCPIIYNVLEAMVERVDQLQRNHGAEV